VSKDGGKATEYSAPSDNKCGGLGGCAVPISASQLFPASGAMKLFDLHAETDSTPLPCTLAFQKGDPVYDIAWAAYCQVLEYRKQQPPKKPATVDDLRLALPPST
jgi:hypothetical protein